MKRSGRPAVLFAGGRAAQWSAADGNAGVRLSRGGSLRVLAHGPKRRPSLAGTRSVAGARVPAPCHAVCRRLQWVAGAALCGGSRRRRHAPPNPLPAERVRRRSPCSRSGASPVSRLRCAGNRAKRPRSLRSGSRSGVDAPAHVVESGPPRQPVPRWCAQRTLAGLGWRSNTLCPLRRLAGLNALRKTAPAVGRSSASRRQTRCCFVRERVARGVPKRAAAGGEQFFAGPCAQGDVSSVGTGGLEPRRSSVENGYHARAGSERAADRDVQQPVMAARCPAL